MDRLETERLVMRHFTPDDWQDLQEVAVDWAAAPGPAFDKWPTGGEECRGFASYLAGDQRYYAVSLRGSGKVIGLLALNVIDADQQLDLGHVVHSAYQDGNLDLEAIGAMVAHLFGRGDVRSIVTRNAPEHAEQLAPLRSLGFRALDAGRPGELTLSNAEWESAGGR